jgi:preprotein translocase SecE subunit
LIRGRGTKRSDNPVEDFDLSVWRKLTQDMAIVKTTASGGNVPEKNNPSNTTPARPNPRAGGGVGVRQGAQPTDRKAFVHDTIAELKRVVWPTREQVRSGVIVTIGLLFFFSLYIYGLDQLFQAVFAALGLENNPTK